MSPVRVVKTGESGSCSDDHIERDPAVLNELQYVDFSSSFSEENLQLHNASHRESQDSFVFSDDDEIIAAAAKHLMSSSPLSGSKKTVTVLVEDGDVTSPFDSVKKLMRSPKKVFVSPKKSTKRHAISPIQLTTKFASFERNKLANSSPGLLQKSQLVDLSPTKPSLQKSQLLDQSPTKPSRLKLPFQNHSPKKNDVEPESTSNSPVVKSSPNKQNLSFLDPSVAIENNDPKITEINKQDIATVNTGLFSSLQQKLVKQPVRNYSTKSTINYPTIQLATQRPGKNEFPSQVGIKQVKPIVLSSEQEYVLQEAVNGTSLFYTGSAGTGKSVLLKSIIKALRAKHKDNVVVTASTGLAACNIGGITLHSFAGVGLANEEVEFLFKRLKRNKKAYQRWISTKVLIIDEVSMVDGHLLNKLNTLAKKARRNNMPFGGIQVIACGDFYQLPPVVKRNNPDGSDNLEPIEAFFSFESDAWFEVIERTLMLKEVFRQKGDQKFIDMLNEMRTGAVSNETVNEFRRLSRPLQCPLGISPAELFATRVEVDRANNTRLNRIPGNAQVFSAVDGGNLDNPQRQTLLSNFLAPQQLYLKKNAQVMCIKNFDETLVNGSLGSVIDFMDKDTYMKACGTQTDDTQDSDFVFNSIDDSQQGEFPQTNEKIETRSAKTTKDAALENKKRKDTLGLDIEKNSNKKKYPLVRFLLPDGVNTRTVLVEPEQWKIEDEQQNVLASRIQLPLILAWSLSIHKSQGQTLPKVKVDLKNVFETGQAYVALSRAVSRDGLQVLNFDKYKVKSHPKVISFYKRLESPNAMEKKPRGQTKLNFATMC
jgi:ATP-dependent DNA helicase PIF1